MQTELPIYQLRQGNSRLLVSMPHVGTHLPAWIIPRLTPEARLLADTDWHLPLLYDFLETLDATILVATHSRYVLDLNRPPDDANLYPGMNTTGICPVDSFLEQPLYLDGRQPDDAEITARIQHYWKPYHQALADELQRIRQLHGEARLWEAHSINSHVPRFFDGELANFNIGTASGQACTPQLAEQVQRIAASSPYNCVVDGRFKGGYITRHYGRPGEGVQALQMEIAFRTYLNESSPEQFDDAIAAPVRPFLQRMLQVMRDYDT